MWVGGTSELPDLVMYHAAPIRFSSEQLSDQESYKIMGLHVLYLSETRASENRSFTFLSAKQACAFYTG